MNVRSKYQKGFTLIEIVVALIVFAVLSVLGYQGLVSVVDYNERSRQAYQEQNQLHRATSILTQDLLHLRPRPIRDRLGGQLRAYDTNDPDYSVVFTRGGLPSVVGSSLGGLQRVAYSVSEDKELLRWTWPVLDSFTEEEPESQVLMTSVESIGFYQLNAANVFEGNWPPLNENKAIDELPRLMRFEIEMVNGDKLERWMPGVQPIPASGRQRNDDDPEGDRGQQEDD